MVPVVYVCMCVNHQLYEISVVCPLTRHLKYIFDNENHSVNLTQRRIFEMLICADKLKGEGNEAAIFFFLLLNFSYNHCLFAFSPSHSFRSFPFSVSVM